MALSKTGALIKLINIGRYPQHLGTCATWTDQTSEYCTCDYAVAAKDYEDLARYIQSLPEPAALSIIEAKITYTEEVACLKR